MAKAKTTTEKPEAKPAVARDKYGCRLNSQSATINAALGNKPKTNAAIAEETGLNANRVRAHLHYMKEKGHVVEGDEGFSLKPIKAAKAAKK
jgi:predicted Rossmann fold nucleotide-binding protein DprA/Smf involved in DNA uptake